MSDFKASSLLKQCDTFEEKEEVLDAQSPPPQKKKLELALKAPWLGATVISAKVVNGKSSIAMKVQHYALHIFLSMQSKFPSIELRLYLRVFIFNRSKCDVIKI